MIDVILMLLMIVIVSITSGNYIDDTRIEDQIYIRLVTKDIVCGYWKKSVLLVMTMLFL